MAEEDIVARLLERCRRDHHAWLNGDATGYVFEGADDSIFGPFGSVILGGERISTGQRRAVAQWESGTGEVELLRGGMSGDIAWLVMVERASVTFRGRQEPQRWELRATEIFVRDGDDWRRTHRHADPLVERQPFDDMLALFERRADASS